MSQIHIRAAGKTQLAKLGELLTYAFQDGNYFEMEDEERSFTLEIDDDPAIYDTSEIGNAEALCYTAMLELTGVEQ